MDKRRKISKSHVLTAFIIGAVFIGTIVAMFAIPPEELEVVSEDGVLTVEGLARGDQLVVIEKRDISVPPLPVVSDIYEVTIDGDPLGPPFTLEFVFKASELKRDESEIDRGITIMTYVPKLLAWRIVPTLVDFNSRILTAEVPSTSNTVAWAYGFIVSGEIPSNEKVLLDELISFPPENAVGYNVVSSFGAEESDFTLLNENRDRGGCGGRYQAGDNRTVTTKEVLSDGKIYRLSAFWQIGDGCSAGEKISSESRRLSD